MYKLTKEINGIVKMVIKEETNSHISIPCNPDNIDFTNFKKEIENDEAELQDADGNTMTADDAKAYIATLP